MSRFLFWHRYSVRVLDTLIWYGYLLMLIVVSFVNDFYSSQIWLTISAYVYLLGGLFVFSVINGGRFNRSGLVRAKYAIMILCAMLLLLLLQIIVPVERHTELLLFNNLLFDSVPPSWFKPHGLWSIVPEKTRWLLNSEVLVFSLFVLSIALIYSRRRLKQLLIVLLCVGLAHSLVAILAKYGGITLVDTKQLDGHFTAARAWFINRNHFAAFISLSMLGALAFQLKFFMSQKNAGFASMVLEQLTSYRIIYLLGLVVGIVALLLSQSRAGFLAFLLSVILVLAFIGKRRLIHRFTLGGRKLLVPTGIVIAVITFYFGGELLLRFSSDSLLGERLAQWSLTWGAITQSWLLGYGGNSYADVFQIHRGYQDFRQVIFNQSHNDYLHIWLEQGLIGLVLWLGLLALAFRSAYAGIKSNASTLVSAILISVLIVVLAALSQSLVDFNLQIVNIRVYFFAIMSLAFSVPAIRQRKRGSENSAHA